MTTKFIELRIHGVSGTSAVDLLEARPVAADTDPRVDLTKPAPTGPWTRAFRWSSLTSGDARSAAWILLLPYMLANLAGWALPPRRSIWRHRFDVTLVRIVGAMLTAMFSLVTAYGFIAIGGYATLGQRFGVDLGLATALGALVTLGVTTGLWWLTRSRETEIEPVLTDPAIEHASDWTALRYAHLAVSASATLWTLGVVAREAFPSAPFPHLVTPIAIGSLIASVIVAGASVLVDLPRINRLTAALWFTASGLVVILGVAIWATSADAPAQDITGAGVPLSILVEYFAAVALATVAASYSRVYRLTAPTVATLLAIAGAAGAAVGAATIQATATVGRTEAPSSVGVIAEGFVVGILALATFVLALHLLAMSQFPSERARIWKGIRAIVSDPLVLMIGTPTIITSVSLLVFWAISEHPETPIFATLAHLAYGAVTILAMAHVRSSIVRVALTALGAISIYLVLRRFADDFRQVAVVATLVLPTQLIGSRLISALRDADQRRALAVPWDVGSYFPSAFHPLAPPPYGATAVDSLRSVLAELSTGNRRPIVVAAHSQGTVIAATALTGVELPVALFTFGSPLGTLYRRFFPAHFGTDFFAHLTEMVSWANLWRTTDPIGGSIDPAIDRPEQPDPKLRIHGGYWFRDELAYNETMGELLVDLGLQPEDIPDLYR